MKIVIICGIVLLLYILITYIMFIFVSRKIKEKIFIFYHNGVERTIAPYKKEIELGNDWVNEKKTQGKVEDMYIKSRDGLKLHGILIRNDKNKGIILEAHGYRSYPGRDLYASCFNYYDMGYSLLLIDQRTNDPSEGKYISFGILESDDVIEWCKYLNKKYKNMPIVLAGVSMGAATVMMAIKDIKPNMNIKCVIADCGFISAYDQVAYFMKHLAHISSIPFMWAINIWCKMLGSFDLKDKNVLDILKDKDIPLLLIHGENDELVPTINSKKIYDSYNGKKDLLIMPGAAHGVSYLVDSKKYIKKIKEFLNEYND